jgi:hypothetical protein
MGQHSEGMISIYQPNATKIILTTVTICTRIIKRATLLFRGQRAAINLKWWTMKSSEW